MIAISPITATDTLSAQLVAAAQSSAGVPSSTQSNVPSSSPSSTTSQSSSTLANSILSSSTASVILSTASIPAGSITQSAPPLSTDTIQLLTDLSSGNFTAAKSDVAKVQQDLQTRPPAVPTANTPPPATSTTLLKQLNSLKASLESGDTSGALSILTNILSQSSSFAGSILNTTA